MSNGIDIRQNEEKSIAMLAAHRQLYSDAKSYAYASIIFSLVIPFCISILLIFLNNKQGLQIASYFTSIVSMVASLIMSSRVKQKKEMAAYIQQKFDVYVYQMPWDRHLFGENKNVDCEIVKYSETITSNIKEKEKLLNWYTEPATQKPIQEGIISCQRENYSWDYELRQRTRNFGIGLVVVLIILVFAIGILNEESVTTLLWRLAFVVPMVQWSLEMVISLNEDMQQLEKLAEKINSSGDKGMEELQEIQRDLYEHRKGCYTIPDIVYNWFKKNDEKQARMVANL